MRRLIAIVSVSLVFACSSSPNSEGKNSACDANGTCTTDATIDTRLTDSSDDGASDASDASETAGSNAFLEGPIKGNGTKTGGYWWTYADHIPSSANAIANTSDFPTTISPPTDMAMAFTLSDPTTHSLPIGPTAKAACIHYKIPAAPKASLIPVSWTFSDAAGGPASPMAGVGFSWQDKNKPFDLNTYVAGGKTGVIGIKFWAAAGDTTAHHPFAVQFPDTHTDVAIPSQKDNFTTTCTCKAGNSGGTAYCTPANGATVSTNSTLHSCLAYWRYNFQPTDTNWHEYTVLFSDLAPGDETTAPPTAPQSPWADNSVPFDTANALKVQFAMYQPLEGGTAVENDLCVTNVTLIMTGDTCTTGIDNCDGG